MTNTNDEGVYNSQTNNEKVSTSPEQSEGGWEVVHSPTPSGDDIDNRIYFKDGSSYALEKKLVKRLNMICERTTQENPKLDALLINEGAEGEGKTNTSIIEAYYFKVKTKRDAHLFFKIDDLTRFAQSTEKKIIIWDEPSLDSLSTDQLSSINKDMQRLFMTVRKKRHIFIINFTKFWKFPEYIVVDRSTCMLHIYTRKAKDFGRFVYIKKRRLEKLWNDYHKLKKRTYQHHKSFGGHFPNVMEKHFDEMDFFVNGIPHATYKIYEQEKDKAIFGIGKSKRTKKELYNQRRLNNLRLGVSEIIKEFNLSQTKVAKVLKVHIRRLQEWKNIEFDDEKYEETGDFEETSPKKGFLAANNSYYVVEGNKNIEEVEPNSTSTIYNDDSGDVKPGIDALDEPDDDDPPSLVPEDDEEE